jgi:hypothetical protein
LPPQLDKFIAASALLPNESMLKSAAVPKAATAVNVWVLKIFVIFLSLGLRSCLIVGQNMTKIVSDQPERPIHFSFTDNPMSKCPRNSGKFGKVPKLEVMEIDKEKASVSFPGGLSGDLRQFNDLRQSRRWQQWQLIRTGREEVQERRSRQES